eukprot:TRINITY_DN279_c3_g1_i1.p1 TRINITY_DN279_c3_g1~~TRINITY_DN279_c3_g1_i1.p1  ORF type:complete len:717 (+),score=249.89 TRINITY_DN279_c3_g1_i1:124-2274(+)
MEKYTIKGRLGAGAFGSVFRCIRKSDGQTYVIKRICIEGLNKNEQSTTMQEVKLMSSLDHPNIVRYYESFIEDGHLCIVMSFCDRGDLSQLIKRFKEQNETSTERKYLPEKRIWFIFLQICFGLHYLHKKRILHRDMKPGNVFMLSGEKVQVGDLGVARVMSCQTNFVKTLVGTPYYLSPELVQDRPYNDKSDVWALGCILHELCEFVHPFAATNQAALILKIIQCNVPKMKGPYSSYLQGIGGMLLRRNSNQRPSLTELLRQPRIRQIAGVLHLQDSYPDVAPNASVNRPIKEQQQQQQQTPVQAFTTVTRSDNGPVRQAPYRHPAIPNGQTQQNKMKTTRTRPGQRNVQSGKVKRRKWVPAQPIQASTNAPQPHNYHRQQQVPNFQNSQALKPANTIRTLHPQQAFMPGSETRQSTGVKPSVKQLHVLMGKADVHLVAGGAPMQANSDPSTYMDETFRRSVDPISEAKTIPRNEPQKWEDLKFLTKFNSNGDKEENNNDGESHLNSNDKFSMFGSDDEDMCNVLKEDVEFEEEDHEFIETAKKQSSEESKHNDDEDDDITEVVLGSEVMVDEEDDDDDDDDMYSDDFEDMDDDEFDEENGEMIEFEITEGPTYDDDDDLTFTSTFIPEGSPTNSEESYSDLLVTLKEVESSCLSLLSRTQFEGAIEVLKNIPTDSDTFQSQLCEFVDPNDGKLMEYLYRFLIIQIKLSERSGEY